MRRALAKTANFAGRMGSSGPSPGPPAGEDHGGRKARKEAAGALRKCLIA
jgi:hypothetical protein